MDIKIAMSLFFSITIIISVLTILNAATRTIKVNIINMAILSSARAENRFLFIWPQSLAQYGKPSMD